jgi:hypothetical protein
MAQLDRLLSVMVSQRATTLRLDESDLAELEIAGATRAVTRTPLTGAQVTSLLREIAPPASVALLDQGRGTSFAYSSDDGSFLVDALREGERWRARVTHDAGSTPARATPSEPLVAPAQDAAAPADAEPPRVVARVAASVSHEKQGAHGEAIADFHGSAQARATLDALP